MPNTVTAKRRKAIAINARLNYLIDSGKSAEEIVVGMRNKVNLKFVNKIILKRGLNDEAS